MRFAGGTGMRAAKRLVPFANIFLFLGADPATDWLRGGEVALDPKGFVVTGTGGDAARGARLPLEANVPGMFAIGDVRAGSVKRVGGAIGEGAAVAAQLHTYLAERRALVASR